MVLCDFCGKSQQEVRALVANKESTAHICDECIYISIEIVAPTFQCSPTRVYEEMKSAQERAIARAQNPSEVR